MVTDFQSIESLQEFPEQNNLVLESLGMLLGSYVNATNHNQIVCQEAAKLQMVPQISNLICWAQSRKLYLYKFDSKFVL